MTRYARCRLPRAALTPCLMCGRRSPHTYCQPCREKMAAKATEEEIATVVEQ